MKNTRSTNKADNGSSGWDGLDVQAFINNLSGSASSTAPQAKPENSGFGVTRGGDVVNKQAANAAGVETTDIPTGVFAASQNYRSSNQQEQDRRFMAAMMPFGSRELTARNGVTGFIFETRCPAGHRYVFFAYFSGEKYQATLVDPPLVAPPAHLSDGSRLCINPAHGCDCLADAYARSCAWTLLYSEYLRTGKWPLSP